MVAYGTCFHLSGPADNKRNADTALVALAFQSAQFAVSAKEGRIGTTLFVWTVIAGEDHNGVFIQPFSFSLSSISPTYESSRVIMAANWAWVCIVAL